VLSFIQPFDHSARTSQTGQTAHTDRTDRQRTDRIGRTVLGRPFVKRFALCYGTVVCPVLSCLSVCLSVGPVCDVRALHCGPNCWRDQDETWRAGSPRPWPHCVRWRPISPSPKGAGVEPPNFRPISVVTKWFHGSRCQLIWRKDLVQATLC